MLTVKHVDPATSSEKIYAAASVEYKPRFLNPDTNEQKGGWSAACVFIANAKGEQAPLGNWGKFYIMNEAGKTVATYDLGGDAPPKSVDLFQGSTGTNFNAQMLGGALSKTYTVDASGVHVHE